MHENAKLLRNPQSRRTSWSTACPVWRLADFNRLFKSVRSALARRVGAILQHLRLLACLPTSEVQLFDDGNELVSLDASIGWLYAPPHGCHLDQVTPQTMKIVPSRFFWRRIWTSAALIRQIFRILNETILLIINQIFHVALYQNSQTFVKLQYIYSAKSVLTFAILTNIKYITSILTKL